MWWDSQQYLEYEVNTALPIQICQENVSSPLPMEKVQTYILLGYAGEGCQWPARWGRGQWRSAQEAFIVHIYTVMRPKAWAGLLRWSRSCGGKWCTAGPAGQRGGAERGQRTTQGSRMGSGRRSREPGWVFAIHLTVWHRRECETNLKGLKPRWSKLSY